MAKELDVGMKCIKYMLFVSNFMFMMIGFLLISIGSTIKAIYSDFENFMVSHYFSPANLAIAIGVIIFFVALFGCVGAFKESTCLVNLYSAFLVVILILEISAAIAAYAMRENIEGVLEKNMQQAMDGYYSFEYDKYSWDFMQERLRCCGIHGPDDWTNSTSASAALISTNIDDANETCAFPESCYRNINCENIFTDGCVDVLSYLVSETALLLGCGALAVAFIQFLGIVFSSMLAKAIRRLKTQGLVERMENRQRIYEQLARGHVDEKVTPVLYTPTSSEA